MDILTRRQLIQCSAIMGGMLTGRNLIPASVIAPQNPSIPRHPGEAEAGRQIASTPIDSSVFGGIFSTEPMRRVFSDENRTQKYLDIEAALARVQGRLGIIPKEAADEIVRHCAIDQIDMAKLKQQTERIGYPILGVVSQINSLCRDKLGEYCHWGATTQDITDTATVLQIREALELIDDDLTAISAVLADLARRYRDTPMVARSNLQQAVPITFGFKMAELLSAI